jgi:hypothetical protein
VGLSSTTQYEIIDREQPAYKKYVRKINKPVYRFPDMKNMENDSGCKLCGSTKYLGGYKTCEKCRINRRKISKRSDEKNKNKIKSRKAKYYAKNKETIKEKTKNYYTKHTIKQKYNKKKRKSKLSNIEFTLRLQEFEVLMTETMCACCHRPFDNNEHSISIDRIKSDVGYVSGNVKAICLRCNTIKNNGTIEDHKMIIEYMKRFH